MGGIFGEWGDMILQTVVGFNLSSLRQNQAAVQRLGRQAQAVQPSLARSKSNYNKFGTEMPSSIPSSMK